MHISMPKGQDYGWGIAGTYLCREAARLPAIDGVTLHCIKGVTLEAHAPEDWNNRNIGYCFFEDNITVLEYTRQAARHWDYIVAGSSWCEYNLRIGGISQTATVLQGIDGDQFYPGPKPAMGDRFVVFSGGKFELRKGQDLVIAAMKIFMQRHDDVVLSCAWHNHWPFSLATMQQSPVITYEHRDLTCHELLSRTLVENGIPLDRVVLHPKLDNSRMRQVYLTSDIGLFPNRCEGGNNMVMCEYMACARPVIASDTTGHGDVIRPDMAFPLSRYHPRYIKHQAEGVWFEPEVEEILALLEYCYTHRSELRRTGMAAAAAMARLTWAESARRFHDIARTVGS